MNRILLTLAVTLLAASAPAAAGTLDVSWTEGIVPDIIGYRLHVGTSSGDYDVVIETTDARARLTDLEDERLYFLRVEALTKASKGAAEAVAISPELVTLPRPEVTQVSPVSPAAPVDDTRSAADVDSAQTWQFTVSGRNIGAEAVVRLDSPSLRVVSVQPDGSGAVTVTARSAVGHTFLSPPVVAPEDVVVINPGRKSPEFFERKPIRADVDGDGTVGRADIDGVKNLLGARRGDDRFDPARDLNGDGRVDGGDLALLGHHVAR